LVKLEQYVKPFAGIVDAHVRIIRIR
jgi:hypothetical protein